MRQICLFGFESDDLCWNVFGNAEEQLSIFLGGGFCCCRRRSLVWVLCVCVTKCEHYSTKPNRIKVIWKKANCPPDIARHVFLEAKEGKNHPQKALSSFSAWINLIYRVLHLTMNWEMHACSYWGWMIWRQNTFDCLACSTPPPPAAPQLSDCCQP